MTFGSAAMEAKGSISGLYLDSKYYQAYPPGMKMTDGVPQDLMGVVVDPHVSFKVIFCYRNRLILVKNWPSQT